MDPDGSVGRCPGEICDRWRGAAGDYEQKKLEIKTCGQCGGNPPLEPTEVDPEEEEASSEELDRLIARVETLYYELAAGRPFDPADLEPWEWSGIVAWKTYEAQFANLQQAKIVALLGGMKGPGPSPGGSRKR